MFSIDPPRWVDESLSSTIVKCRNCGERYEWEEGTDNPHECQNCLEPECQCSCPMPENEDIFE